MRILLTGGAGYVGSACLRHLAGAGHEVVAYDNLVTGHPGAVAGAELIEGDILDTDRLAEAMAGADAVMHFAAATRVDESVTDPAPHWELNVIGTLSVLQAMARAGVKRIVFSSTCAVYGDVKEMPVSEATPIAPVSPYAETKFAAEGMIGDFAQAQGLGVVILRYFNAGGADPSGDFGDPRPASHLLPLVLDAAAGRRDELLIFGDDYDTRDGTCIRDFVHVDDLARAHALALQQAESGSHALYNLGTGTGHTINEIIEVAHRVTGRNIPVRMVPRRGGDIPAMVADSGHAERNLGWRPEHDLESLLVTAWRWHQGRPERYGPKPLTGVGSLPVT